MPLVKITDTLPPGTLTEFRHQDKPYAVCNVAGEIRVLSGICPHHGGPLGQGALEGSVISCPWHCWQFETKSGECLFGNGLAVPVYDVRVSGDGVFADLP